MTELIQGGIATVLVLAMVAIAVVEQVQGRPFSEPLTLSALTSLAVGFYFGRSGNTAARSAAAQAAATTLAGVAAASVLPPAAARPPEVQP